LGSQSVVVDVRIPAAITYITADVKVFSRMTRGASGHTRIANTWLIVNVGARPAPWEPSVTLGVRADRDMMSAACYETWKSRRAEFITEPKQKYDESARPPTVRSGEEILHLIACFSTAIPKKCNVAVDPNDQMVPARRDPSHLRFWAIHRTKNWMDPSAATVAIVTAICGSWTTREYYWAARAMSRIWFKYPT
jgi:hypothetical protein